MLRNLLLATALVLPGVVTLPAVQALGVRFLRPGVTLTMLGVLRTGEDGRLPDARWVPLEDLGPWVPRAAVASEDARFWAHRGFDREAICDALDHNREGGSLRGGSTISQQTARNVFLWQGRSWVRKGLEAWYTLFLEALVPKGRILELYLNVAELGPSVYGFEAASQHWYRASAASLDPARVGRLVALLPSPRRRTPTSALASEKAAWIARHPAPFPGDRTLDAVQAKLDAVPWWPPCPVPPGRAAK